MGFDNYADTANDQNTSQDDGRSIDHGILNEFIRQNITPHNSENPKVVA